MSELLLYFQKIAATSPSKIIISNPISNNQEFQKIVAEKKKDGYQISKYTDKQVFHENIKASQLASRCEELTTSAFRQVNAIAPFEEHIVMISKKGVCNYKLKRMQNSPVKLIADTAHNRKKNYILEEGLSIPPLVDMGVFTAEGRVVKSMYDKYKQINRFIEIIDDELKNYKGRELGVIDFGCGKSYLTFVVYYYLTEIRKIKTRMIGLDLKADVIRKCNAAAEKYGYTDLKFELGDINGFSSPFDVDMVVTLHACDTATDYALFNAIGWNAKMIFSVPCCQHELNSQLEANELSILSRYGILKERFSAIATDAIRGNLLEYCGYKTQLLEFVDFDHTPKNILIRAVKRDYTSQAHKEKLLAEIESMNKEFGFNQTLYRLLQEIKKYRNKKQP